jgi:hypothetical protein
VGALARVLRQPAGLVHGLATHRGCPGGDVVTELAGLADEAVASLVDPLRRALLQLRAPLLGRLPQLGAALLGVLLQLGATFLRLPTGLGGAARPLGGELACP